MLVIFKTKCHTLVYSLPSKRTNRKNKFRHDDDVVVNSIWNTYLFMLSVCKQTFNNNNNNKNSMY